MTNDSPEKILDMIAEQHICAENIINHNHGGDSMYQYHKDTRDWLTQIYVHRISHPIKSIEHDLLWLNNDFINDTVSTNEIQNDDKTVEQNDTIEK